MSEEKRIERIEDISIDNRGRIIALEKMTERLEKYIIEQRRLIMGIAIVVIAALARYFFGGG